MINFTEPELLVINDACKKRIDRSLQKIKYWTQNQEKLKDRSNVIFDENIRIKSNIDIMRKISDTIKIPPNQNPLRKKNV